MGRLSGPPAPSHGEDAEVWQQLGDLGSRLASTMVEGSATRIRDEWLELDVPSLKPDERIEVLIARCLELGAPAARASELVGFARERAALPGVADARRRSAERRERLTDPNYWRSAQ